MSSELPVSSSATNNDKIVDLTLDAEDGENQNIGKKRAHESDSSTSASKKKTSYSGSLSAVWVVYHQLEAGGYECVGDYRRERKYLSHTPKNFNKTILGIYKSLESAQERAREECLDHFGDEEDQEGEEFEEDEQNPNPNDFRGKGRFRSGAVYSGDVNTFSERIYIEKQQLFD